MIPRLAMYSQTQIEHVTLLMMDVLETNQPLYLDMMASDILEKIDKFQVYRDNIFAGILMSLSFDNFICAFFHRICFDRSIIRRLFIHEMYDLMYRRSHYYKLTHRQWQLINILVGKGWISG